MEEKTVLLESLPDDLDRVRPKLELYFKNKRKSGGEVKEIRDHPEDKRKALLIYLQETELNNVLKREHHDVDFKNHGVVKLTVKLLDEKKEKVKPALLPRPKKEIVNLLRLAQPRTDAQSDSKLHKGNEDNSESKDLLISTTESVDKDILTMYFEQFTENAEITKHGKNKWILKVANHSDLLKILDQQTHEFDLTVKLYKEVSVGEQKDPRRFILSGFKDNCKCKYVSMFIGSCSQKAAHDWEIIDEERILVTFKEDIDSKSFLEKCASKNLQGMEIEASHLDYTDSILVQGDMSKLTEEMLNLYFTNNKRSAGGHIKSLIWVNKKKSVVISFEDCHVAQQVVERKHHVCGTDLSTVLFYSHLQNAFTGETPTWSNIITNITIPVDEALHNYIEKNQKCRNDFECQLRVVNTHFILDKTTPTGQIALGMAVDKDSLAALRLGATWESKAQKAAEAFLSRYSTIEFPVEVEIWERVERECLECVSSDVEVTYIEAKAKIAIVGLNKDVTAISDKIQKRIKDATVELQMEKNTVERIIQFDSKQELELVEECVQTSNLQDVHLTKNETNLTILLQGLRNNVSDAERVIKQAQDNISFVQLDLSAHLGQFLKSLDLKKFEQSHFATCHIPALFMNDGELLWIVADKQYIQRAKDKVKSILREEVIQLTLDVNSVIYTENWENFLNKIKVELSQKFQSVNVIASDAHIIVCGFADVVEDLSKKIKDYLENKTPATEYIQLKSLQESGFVESCMKLSEIPEIKNLDKTIQSCRTMNSPCLKVTASKEKIQDVISVLKRHISSIYTEKQTYSKAGESKVILKHEANIQANAKEYNCKAYISTHKIGPLKSYSHQINSDITFTVTEGELQHFEANALVCPMSSKLAFENPIAQKFLQVAGSDIQMVCKKIQKEKQTVLAGEVILTDPGIPNAKSLIYTVLAQSSQPLNLGFHYLRSAIFNSLQKAESRNYTSIAMPTIGCEGFGFSIKESCMAIREAVLQFSSDQPNSPKNIKNIFVVISDVKILEEFNNIIDEQGFSDVKASATPTSTRSEDQTKPANLKPVSDTEVTVHGVRVCLKKGDITKETVDVIVNSNNKALDLNTGVSGAILKAAGQSVVDECKKHGQRKQNEVVLTSGGKLSCKHIAQMVGPNNAADITISVEKVLKLCETTVAATVVFPAIGTGRGGIEAKESIMAILAGVEKYMTQSTSTTLQKITVVAFEQKILDKYCKYFTERNQKTLPTNMPANTIKIEGVWIEIKKGNITSQSVRGIVNTTNNKMNLTTGVSGAIFKAAGPSVQQQCQKIGSLQGNIAAVTSAGNLPCDFIIHMTGPHSSDEARKRVKNVLEKCEEKQISTISFPAVGTGGGGVNSADAITAMLQGFHDHLSQHTSTVIKLIYIVIDRDEILEAFQQGLHQWTPSSQETEAEECDDEEEYYNSSSGEEEEEEEGEGEEEEEEEEDDCSGTITEAIIGRIKVKVLCGDITKETTDAIVSSTNISLDLSSGVSGAILKAAGQTVVDECKKLGVQPSNGVVFTTGGKLPVKYIVHMVGQTQESNIIKSMYKVLKKCEEKKIQSVSFPALGTGAGNLAAAQVANVMMVALANFAVDSPACLTTVHIVIFQSAMLADFEDAMKKFKKISRNLSSVAASTSTQQFTTSASPKPKLCLATATAGVTFPVTNVDIYGTSSTDIAKVKKFLDDLVSDECISKDIQSIHLDNLSEADNKAIVELSQSNQVCVLVAAKDKLIVSGKKDDVLDTVLNIRSFLQAANDRKIRESEEQRLSNTLRWEVAKGETWLPLNSSISYELELAFHTSQEFSYKDNGETYKVNFKEMIQCDTKGKSCKIKRTLFADSETAIIQPPPTWTKMDGRDLEIVPLSPISEEYKKIERHFLRSSQHKDIAPVQVVQIRRIQNQPQWQRYCVLKQAVDKKYPKQKNEQFLYHGTTKDICQKINRNGFNRSFCGRNAVVHGDGTYFAKEAWYSCYDQYSNPDENALKYIYRARVVTGLPCKSRGGMKEPDPLDPKDPRAGLHDCAVDNLKDPFIFVVFCDAGAYPDYLISFKNA